MGNFIENIGGESTPEIKSSECSVDTQLNTQQCKMKKYCLQKEIENCTNDIFLESLLYNLHDPKNAELLRRNFRIAATVPQGTVDGNETYRIVFEPINPPNSPQISWDFGKFDFFNILRSSHTEKRVLHLIGV